MRLPGNRHLCYCSNVHPGETWAETFAALQENVPEVRRRVCPDEPFGVGLRLSAAAAAALADGELGRFKAWLDRERCYVFTVNGFAYGAFHGGPVKERVFEPDWTTEARCEYTRTLARLLAALLPEGVRGSISTVPLGYRPVFDGVDAEAKVAASADALVRLAAFLVGLEASSGKRVRLAVEPEPDGAIETCAEFMRFFQQWLLPAARRRAGRAGEDYVRRHIGLCVDSCHASVVGEDIEALLPTIADAGLIVAKLQVSAALRVDWQADDESAILERLTRLADPVYLHQVRVKIGEGMTIAYPDLATALESAPRGEWRVHYHVPIDAPFFAGFASTHDDTAHLLGACVRGQYCRHLEIETYTWDMLPEHDRGSLHESIAREFRWTLDHLAV